MPQCHYSLQKKCARIIGFWGEISGYQHYFPQKYHILKGSTCLHNATLGSAAWSIINTLVSHP